MKKISIIILTIVLLFTSVSLVFAETSRFTDLSTSHWAYDNVILLVDLGVINGYGDGTFRPNNNISIAEFTKLVLCAIGNDVGNATIGKWYLNYINEAIKIGLIEEGEYTNYDNYITRSEMSKIVVNALGADYVYPENLVDYIDLIKDYYTIDDEYKDYILKAYSLGILTGNGDGTFRPNNFALRTEASTIVARLIFPDQRILPDLEPKEEETIPSGTNPFTFYDEMTLWNLANYNSSPTSGGYRVDNNTIIFNGGGTSSGEDYVVAETLNPNINYQLYNVTKSLIDQDH
ncbi:MAG: S-layer homology domain-containing protein, partial [Vulcanibacillus sp.]